MFGRLKKLFERPPAAPRGRVSFADAKDTGSGMKAKAEPKPSMRLAVYRAKEDRWYTQEEMNIQTECHMEKTDGSHSLH